MDPQISQLKDINADLRVTVDNLEKERDFYFRKLRDIEIFTDQIKSQNLCIPHIKLIDAIQSILYATDESQQLHPDTLIQSIIST